MGKLFVIWLPKVFMASRFLFSFQETDFDNSGPRTKQLGEHN